MDALVTVRFRFDNVCNPSDLRIARRSFPEMVTYLITEDGGLSLGPGEFEIVAIEEVKA